MTGPYCGECGGRSKSQEDIHSESTLSSIEKDRPRVGTDFAGERGEEKTGRDRYELVRREKLQLTPCDLGRCLKLGHRGHDQYDLLQNTVVSRAGMIEHDEHTQISSGLSSLNGRVWIDGRRVRDLYELRVKERSMDAATLLKESIALVEREVGVGWVVFPSIKEKYGVKREREGKE